MEATKTIETAAAATETTTATTAAAEAAKLAAETAAAEAAKAAKLAAEGRLTARLMAPRFHNETVLSVAIGRKAGFDIYQTLKLVDAVRGQLGSLASLALDNMALTVRRPDKDGGIKGTGKGSFESKETLGSQISRLARDCEKFAKATGIDVTTVLHRSIDGDVGDRLTLEVKALVS